MNLSTLRTSLTVLGTVKKQLNLNQGTEQTWYQVLRFVSDEDGQRAFGELMGTTIFGDPEPAHILELVEKYKAQRIQTPTDGHPWISQAPKFSGEKFEDLDQGRPTASYALWREAEQHKRYRATDQHDNIFLIQNPEAWDWALKGGKICFIRPEPEPTGDKRSDGVKQKDRPKWKTHSY